MWRELGSLELAVLSLSLLLASGAVERRLYARQEDGASGEDPLTPGGSSGCSDFDVRLVGGNSSYMGMVEACYSTGSNSSLWGPICVTGGTQWTVAHAMTVCNQLGFPPSDAAFIVYENVMGPYSYDIWCDAWDPPERLEGCFVDETAPTCNAKRAGGVICHVPEDKRCEEGDVRPVNGSRLAGRLEVCFKGVWGTVCKHQQWSRREASVVCRQLGFNNSAIPIGVATEIFGAGPLTQPIRIRDVKCSGNETNISECMYSDQIVGNCLHGDDAGVICEAPPGSCRDEDIRLEGGSEDEEFGNGIINVCYTGLWGTVCGTERDWDEMDAVVACRQLGYAELVSTEIRPIQKADRNVQSLLSGVNCSGSEERLADCDHDGVDFEDTTGCARAFVICKEKIVTGMPPTSPPDNSTTPSSPTSAMTSSTSSSMDDSAVVIGSSVGAILLLLAVVVVIAVVATLIVLREKTVRKKMSYNLENARESPSVPAYIQMHPRQASNYLEPVSSRTQVDIYSEWRDILKNLLLAEDQLVLTESLGEGAFGRVYKGTMKCADETTAEVAIKTLKDISSPDNIDNFVKESILMLGFDHPNVLRLLGVCFDTTDFLPLIVLPFMTNGDLRSYLMAKRGTSVCTRLTRFPEGLDEQKALAMCLDVAKGMEYLSSSSFVHRDLAARNCMVSGDLTVQIADFGLSRDVYSKDYYRMGTKTMLPVKWMAPEGLADNIFTVKSDVWAFGVVCWEVFSLGSTPYPGVGNHEVSDYIGSGRRLKMPTLCPQEIYHVMEMCWSEDSNRRPTFPELVVLLEGVVTNSEAPHYINMENGTTPPQNGHAVQPQ